MRDRDRARLPLGQLSKRSIGLRMRMIGLQESISSSEEIVGFLLMCRSGQLCMASCFVGTGISSLYMMSTGILR